MTTISATLVKQLREKTGAVMMDCKQALVECDAEIEKAVDFLRKKRTGHRPEKSWTCDDRRNRAILYSYGR